MHIIILVTVTYMIPYNTTSYSSIHHTQYSGYPIHHISPLLNVNVPSVMRHRDDPDICGFESDSGEVVVLSDSNGDLAHCQSVIYFSFVLSAVGLTAEPLVAIVSDASLAGMDRGSSTSHCV